MKCSRAFAENLHLIFPVALSLLQSCGSGLYNLAAVKTRFEEFDTFKVDLEAQKVDVLFVVDNSGSMSDNQEILANSMGSFIEEFVNRRDSSGAVLPQIDFHVGVITTDSNPSAPLDGHWEAGAGTLIMAFGDGVPVGTSLPKFLSLPNLEEIGEELFEKSKEKLIKQFKLNARPGIYGSGAEAPLLAVAEFLQPHNQEGWNKGFLRPDSYFAVVIVSDEDESLAGCRKVSLDPFLQSPECRMLRSTDYMGVSEAASASRYQVFADHFLAVRAEDPEYLSLDVVIAEEPQEVQTLSGPVVIPPNGKFLKETAEKIRLITDVTGVDDRVHNLLNPRGFGSDIQKIGNKLANRVGRTFKLTSKSIVASSLRIFINDRELEPAQFKYNESKKRVVLAESAYDGIYGTIEIKASYDTKVEIAGND